MSRARRKLNPVDAFFILFCVIWAIGLITAATIIITTQSSLSPIGPPRTVMAPLVPAQPIHEHVP